MKRLTGIASVLLLLATPMFGSSKKPQTVVIPQAVQVGATNLPSGTYKLSWTGTEPEVQATLTTSKGQTVVTFAAKAVVAKTGNSGVDIDSTGSPARLRAIFLDNINLTVESAQPHQSGN